MKSLINFSNALIRALRYPLPSYLRVLMVDDSDDDFVLTQRAVRDGRQRGLCSATILVEHARSAAEGFERIKEGWDCILVDWKLQTFGDGLDFIRRCRDLDYTGPFLVMSGSDEALHQQDEIMLLYGVMAFVDKNCMANAALNRAIRYAVKDYRIVQTAREMAV